MHSARYSVQYTVYSSVILISRCVICTLEHNRGGSSPIAQCMTRKLAISIRSIVSLYLINWSVKVVALNLAYTLIWPIVVHTLEGKSYFVPIVSFQPIVWHLLWLFKLIYTLPGVHGWKKLFRSYFRIFRQLAFHLLSRHLWIFQNFIYVAILRNKGQSIFTRNSFPPPLISKKFAVADFSFRP